MMGAESKSRGSLRRIVLEGLECLLVPAARMACLDVTESPQKDHVKKPPSSFNSALEDVVGDHGKPGSVSFI